MASLLKCSLHLCRTPEDVLYVESPTFNSFKQILDLPRCLSMSLWNSLVSLDLALSICCLSAPLSLADSTHFPEVFRSSLLVDHKYVIRLVGPVILLPFPECFHLRRNSESNLRHPNIESSLSVSLHDKI